MKSFINKYSETIIRITLILILFFVQLSCIILLAYFLHNNAIFAYFLLEIISVLILIPLLADTRSSAYKLLWMSVILVLPIVGHIMYQLWGKGKIHKKAHIFIQGCVNDANRKQVQDYKIVDELTKEGNAQGKITNYLFRQGYPLYKNTELEFFEVGEEAFDDIEKELRKAQKFILLSFFTIADGIIWGRIENILVEKVSQGVEIKLMYDDVGSAFQISDKTIKRLKDKKIEVSCFNSIEKSFLRMFANYRNHQKIIVIDGNVGYTGGINASDRYANIDSPYGHWKDNAVRLKGDAVWSLSLILLGMWNATGKDVDCEKYRPSIALKNDTYCQPFADGPSNNPRNQGIDMYKHMINEAHEKVYITTPYLVLDDDMRDTLCLAAKSGIDVRIITPGVADKKKTKLLTEWNYGYLLRAGVRIFEYMPGFMHGKTCLNDFSVVTGTINMDFRSFYLHYESAIWTTDLKLRESIYKDYMESLEVSREVTYEEWALRPLDTRIKQLILQVFKCQF